MWICVGGYGHPRLCAPKEIKMSVFKKSKRIVAICFFIFFCISSGFSSTVREHEFECPICSTKFNYRVQYSYSLFGQNLDLKPVGAAIIPTPIPKCEKCGFVFEDDLFSEEELKILKEYLSKNNLPDADKNYPNYYYLGQEMLILNKPIENIAWVFLESVWENNNEKNKSYLMSNAIKYFELVPETSESYENFLLIRVDLERRKGNFENAAKIIEIIKQRTDFYKGYIIEIVDCQEKLIKAKDIEEHSLP